MSHTAGRQFPPSHKEALQTQTNDMLFFISFSEINSMIYTCTLFAYLHPHTFQGALPSLPSGGPAMWSSLCCDCRAQRASSVVLGCVMAMHVRVHIVDTKILLVVNGWHKKKEIRIRNNKSFIAK